MIRDQRDGGDVLAQAVRLGHEQQRRDHQHVIGVDDHQPVEVVQRIDDEVRQRIGDDGQGRDIDAALAPNDLWVGRHDPDRHQALEPAGELQAALALGADKVAQSRHDCQQTCLSAPKAKPERAYDDERGGRIGLIRNDA